MRTPDLTVRASDCEWQFIRGTGNGGQNRNKRSTAVRVVHRPSGAVGYAEDERRQLDNRRLAFARMARTPRFVQWCRDQVDGIERAVREQMRDANLFVEVRREGVWCPE